jgi:hypothetical protein
MGWSCSSLAHKTIEKIQAACLKQSDSQNVWTDKGNKFFFELSRKEHNDGAITGSIFKFVSTNHVLPAGSFRINADGSIKNFPHNPLKING